MLEASHSTDQVSYEIEVPLIGEQHCPLVAVLFAESVYPLERELPSRFSRVKSVGVALSLLDGHRKNREGRQIGSLVA
jgi:hypothetical protein